MYVVKVKECRRVDTTFEVWPHGGQREVSKREAIERFKLYLYMANNGIPVEGIAADGVFIIDTRVPMATDWNKEKRIMLSQNVGLVINGVREKEEPVGPWAKKVVMP